MRDSNDPDISAFTTAKLVRAHEAAQARLIPLAGIVAPVAKARPETLVPDDVLVLAQQALRAIAPIALSLGAPSPIPLHPPLTYAGLAAKLALATAQATTFRERYWGYNDRLAGVVWHVLDWLETEETRRAVLDDLERTRRLLKGADQPRAAPGPEPKVSPAEA